MLWLQRLLIAGAMLAPLSVTAQTPESRVAESWEKAVIYLPGELKPTPRGEIKLDKPTPVALFMHGCAGIGKDDHAWARLLAEKGLLVVMPDSLARTDRQPSCDPAKLKGGLFPPAAAMRLEEISYATGQIRKQSWFDGKNLFLMG